MRLLSVLVAGCTLAAGAVASANDLTISVSGECPGMVHVTYDGAAANRWAVLVFGHSQGELTLPFGPCGGTILGLNNDGLRLIRVLQTAPEGRGELAGHANNAACGGFLQLIVQEGNPCQTSNVVQIPQ